MSIGENIRRIRKEKGMTQKELGEKLGISQAAIGQFENDNSNLKIDTIKKIAVALDVEYTRLIIETPFSSGSREERQKMTDDELADYLTYLTTKNQDLKKEILSRYETKKQQTEQLKTDTLAAHFDGEEFTDEELEEIMNFVEFVKNKRNK